MIECTEALPWSNTVAILAVVAVFPLCVWLAVRDAGRRPRIEMPPHTPLWSWEEVKKHHGMPPHYGPETKREYSKDRIFDHEP